MRRVNTDNLFYGEVLIDRYVWIDATTRGMNENGEKSKDPRLEHNHKVIIQITNWRFLVTMLNGGIGDHKGYWDFSWGEIRQVSSSDNWTRIALKDNSVLSIKQDDAHIAAIRLWILGEALKAEEHNGIQQRDVWRQSQLIDFTTDTDVPFEGEWTLILQCYGIILKKGEKPRKAASSKRLNIDSVNKAFSRKNLKVFNQDYSGESQDCDKSHGSDAYTDFGKEDTSPEASTSDWTKRSEVTDNEERDVASNNVNEIGNENNRVPPPSERTESRTAKRRSPSQQKTLNAIHALIGLEDVKERIVDIVNLAAINEERKKQGLNPPVLSMHMVFTGNPGTGKTTIARMLGDIFKTLGLLSKGHFVEVDRSALVGGYLGQTAIKTTAVLESALGGVLFIDEAYALSPGLDGDQFGQEAIDTILAFMENHRNDIVVIVAGYTKEMQDFVNSNPGLKSRFNMFIHFSDYTPDEMKKIFLSMAYVDKYVVHSVCDAGLDELFTRLTSRMGKGFGNGREVRNMYERTLLKQNRRLMTLTTLDRNQLVEILPCDLPLQSDLINSKEKNEPLLESKRIRIESLVGIQSVKNELKKIVDMGRVARIRSEVGLPQISASLHMVFTGSPGTGKTTVARYLAQELYDLGILARNQIVEVSRSDLVAGYLGQTAIKTIKVLDSALGGVLFIDEAYSLNQQYYSGPDSYGLEAIDTLLKYMEDNKDSLMVIAAGYESEMNRFLGSNPGLASRFNRFIHFNDYSNVELCEVFHKMALASHFIIDENANEAIKKAIESIRHREGQNFSNARAVRNLFEKTIENQATRVMEIASPTRHDVQLIITEDLDSVLSDHRME